MRIILVFSAILMSSVSLSAQAELYVTIVQGLGGEPTFEENFHTQSQTIAEASASLTDADKITFFNGDDATRENLLRHFSTQSAIMDVDDRAAIYLIGHGGFDGEEYKFNIPGIDITTDDILNVMDSFPGQNHFLLNTSSTSGALLEPLANENRILVTATRNGNEKNATFFGEYFVEALSSEDADLNKNNNISIEEAFGFAQRQVEEYFESQGQLATEHPELTGNGAAQFTIARINQVAISTENPRIAELQEQNLEIDRQIESLQLRRTELSNEDYIEQLQALILQSARINEEIDQLTRE
ncbi:MAG: C13 family peptidase [Gammaproteobacteria bacterium]|nr:C13 family peptidase [Gammaproteobacteria bacterium]